MTHITMQPAIDQMIDDGLLEIYEPHISNRADNIQIIDTDCNTDAPNQDQIIEINTPSSDDESDQDCDTKPVKIGGTLFYKKSKYVDMRQQKFMYKYTNFKFAAANSVDDMIDTINMTTKKQFHEICYKNIKLFADLDKYKCSDTKMAICLVQILEAVFTELRIYKYDRIKSQFQLDSTGKSSMHFIYNSDMIFKVNHYNIKDPSKNIHGSQTEFWQYVKEYIFLNENKYPDMINPNPIDDNDKLYIDFGVYNNKHAVRTVYSLKDQKCHRYFRPAIKIRPQILYNDTHDINSSNVINDPFCTNYYDFEIFPDIPITATPKYSTTLDEQKIRDALADKCPGMAINNIDGSLIKMTRVNPGKCPFSGKTHTRQHGYAVSYNDGLYYFCNSNSCTEPVNTDNYKKNNNGKWGVFITKLHDIYSIVKTLNKPIDTDNWRAKNQDIHTEYISKEPLYNDYNRLAFLTNTEYVNKITGDIWDEKNDDILVKQRVLTKESRSVWKQWVRGTVIRIAEPGKNYFLVKVSIYKPITKTNHIRWEHVDKRVMYETELYIAPTNTIFSIYMPAVKHGKLTIGSFIEEAYATGLIPIYDTEMWIPYDIRRIPKIPYGWNAFRGFDAEISGQHRLQERLIKVKPTMLNKSSHAYEALQKNYAIQTNNINLANDCIDDDKTHKVILATLQSYIDNSSSQDEKYQRQTQYNDEIINRDNDIASRHNASNKLRDIKLKMLEYESDDYIENEDYLDESKNKIYLTRLMRKHQLNILCNNNKQLFACWEKFFAHMIQYPEQKPAIALVWFGLEGSGKDVICEWMSHIIGAENYCMIGDITQFTSTFNASYANKMICCFNETTEAKISHVADLLKHLFGSTQDGSYEQKYEKRKINQCSFERYFINTNHEHQAKIPYHDRHYVMFKLNNEKCAPTPSNKKYFDDLWAEVRDPDAQIDAFQYFKHLDITDYDPTVWPMTDYKRDEIEYNLDSVNQMILKMGNINSFDSSLEQLMQLHIRNLKDYQMLNYENELDKEIVYNSSDWSFDYEFQVSHMWEFYTKFCEDQGIAPAYIKRKRALKSQLKSYIIGKKLNKKTNVIENQHLVEKIIRTKCSRYSNTPRIKGYRFTPDILRMIVEDQLHLQINKEIEIEIDDNDNDNGDNISS